MRVCMTSDKKTFLAEANASVKPILIPSRVWKKQGSGRNNMHKAAQRVHEQVECFSWSRTLSCFFSGQTILSEGHGCGVKKDIWSVMEDFSKAPGGKDLSKMKTQYEMFVDDVGSMQVTV